MNQASYVIKLPSSKKFPICAPAWGYETNDGMRGFADPKEDYATALADVRYFATKSGLKCHMLFRNSAGKVMLVPMTGRYSSDTIQKLEIERKSYLAERLAKRGLLG